jgi:hypothetical protein
VKFLVDMPLSPALRNGDWLVAREHDAVDASPLDLDRAAGSEILKRAAQDARKWLPPRTIRGCLSSKGRSEPSLILFRGGEWGGVDVIAQMQQIFDRMASARRTEQPIAGRAAVKSNRYTPCLMDFPGGCAE